MKKLHQLINGLEGTLVPRENPEIQSIAYDSRKVSGGTLFVAIKGHKQDGHDYIAKAAAAGAVAVVCESEIPGVSIPQIVVPDSRLALGFVADRFYDSPSKSLHVIGVTGTNGKTTTALALHAILNRAGHRTAFIGTIGIKIGEQMEPAILTTPESLELHELFARMVHDGASHVVMEVSSHALALKRVAHVTFQAGIFTNLTHEHIDFHKSMDEYLNAKLKLFDAVEDQPGRPAFAVLNCDDSYFEKIKKHVSIPVLSYGAESSADVRAENIRMDETKLHFDLIVGNEKIEILSSLGGLFNVSNLLAAAATAHRLGVSPEDIRWVIERLPRVPGRFESIDCDQPFHVIVDFAHTPDGLEKLLTSVRDITEGKLITLFGCPGERDKEKRPMMGEIAARMSDIVIVTTDDPHHEDPKKIINDIVPGVAAGGKTIGRDAFAVVDRKEAIALALSKASAGDSVVLAGRGHETVQDFAGKKIPLDDRTEAARLLTQSR